MSGKVRLNGLLIFEHAFKTLEKESQEGLNSTKIKEKLEGQIGHLSENEKKQIYPQVPGVFENDQIKLLQFIPSTVMLSFTIELALKILIEQRTGNNVRGHQLTNLLNELPEDLGQEIKRNTCAKMEITEDKFDEYVANNNNGFVDWRYFYEKNNNSHLGFLKNLYEKIKEKLDWPE